MSNHAIPPQSKSPHSNRRVKSVTVKLIAEIPKKQNKSDQLIKLVLINFIIFYAIIHF